jgi:Putative GTPase activating protein for Arf
MGKTADDQPAEPEAMATSTLSERLKSILDRDCNRKCAECSEPAPTWACLLTMPLDDEGTTKVLGILCCYKCYGAHFQLGEDVGTVKSTRRVESWTEDEIQVLERSGNQVVNEIYEHKLHEQDKLRKLEENKDDFVKKKYKELVYFSKRAFLNYQKDHNKNEDATTSIFKLPARLASSNDGIGLRGLQAMASALPMTPSFDWVSFSKASPSARDLQALHARNCLDESSEHSRKHEPTMGGLMRSLSNPFTLERMRQGVESLVQGEKRPNKSKKGVDCQNVRRSPSSKKLSFNKEEARESNDAGNHQTEETGKRNKLDLSLMDKRRPKDYGDDNASTCSSIAGSISSRASRARRSPTNRVHGVRRAASDQVGLLSMRRALPSSRGVDESKKQVLHEDPKDEKKRNKPRRGVGCQKLSRSPPSKSLSFHKADARESNDTGNHQAKEMGKRKKVDLSLLDKMRPKDYGDDNDGSSIGGSISSRASRVQRSTTNHVRGVRRVASDQVGMLSQRRLLPQSKGVEENKKQAPPEDPNKAIVAAERYRSNPVVIDCRDTELELPAGQDQEGNEKGLIEHIHTRWGTQRPSSKLSHGREDAVGICGSDKTPVKPDGGRNSHMARPRMDGSSGKLLYEKVRSRNGHSLTPRPLQDGSGHSIGSLRTLRRSSEHSAFGGSNGSLRRQGIDGSLCHSYSILNTPENEPSGCSVDLPASAIYDMMDVRPTVHSFSSCSNSLLDIGSCPNSPSSCDSESSQDVSRYTSRSSNPPTIQDPGRSASDVSSSSLRSHPHRRIVDQVSTPCILDGGEDKDAKKEACKISNNRHGHYIGRTSRTKQSKTTNSTRKSKFDAARSHKDSSDRRSSSRHSQKDDDRRTINATTLPLLATS